MATKRKPPTHLNNNIRLEREKRRLTRKELAQKILASEDSIVDWENGYLPGKYSRNKLCEEFGKSEEELWPLIHKTPVASQESTLLLVYPGHSSWMTTARWSPNGMQIASGGADKMV